jgi:hypothetical protein
MAGSPLGSITDHVNDLNLIDDQKTSHGANESHAKTSRGKHILKLKKEVTKIISLDRTLNRTRTGKTVTAAKSRDEQN